MRPDILAEAANEELDELTGLVLDPDDPVPTARLFIERFHSVDGIRALQHQLGSFYSYRSEISSYSELDPSSIRAALYELLGMARRWTEPRGNQPAKLVPFKPNKNKIDNVLDALRAVCDLPSEQATPCWLEARELSPVDIIACSNGLLHIPTRELLPATPQFFTLTGLNFDFKPVAPKPEKWLRFLLQLWPNDPESIETLQEWIGYLLTARTHLQKILMLVGPKRSGKGTIGRVIKMLLGARNVCGPTLSNLSEQFGLSVLIDKSAAIIADARISGRTDTAVVTERLLSISGEDTLSIPRKFQTDWTGRLPTRFTIMTNELPRIEDSSGALASRFVVLMLSESFYGRENHTLLDQFIPELPNILLWALDGWDRLDQRGRLEQPQSAAQMIQEFEDLGSPIGAFLRERCDVGRAFEVMQDSVFDAWKEWCSENGRERPGTTQTFAKNLRAAIPGVKVTRPRVAGSQIRYWEGLRLKGESR